MIVYLVQWRDAVVFPAGFAWPDGVTRGEQVLMVEGRLAAAYRVEPPEAWTGDETVEVAEGAVVTRWEGEEAGGKPRLKPGILRLLSGADPWLLLAGLGCVLATLPGQAGRWWWLLRTAGLEVSFSRAMRLTMVGQFFNVCMPGTTGGDFMKAYYAARNSGQKEAAVMSVVMDRLLGLVGLVVMAALVGLFTLEDPISRLVTLGVWITLVVTVAAAMAYFNPKWRRRLGLGKLLAWLPWREGLTRLHRATAAYGGHPWVLVGSIGFSIVMHALFVASLVLSGRALGVTTSVPVLATLLPLVLLVGSLPISLLGLGVMEAVAVPLLVGVGHASANAVLGMLMMLRVDLLAAAAVGAVWVVRGGFGLFPGEGGRGGEMMHEKRPVRVLKISG